jgi:hypothetical protein
VSEGHAPRLPQPLQPHAHHAHHEAQLGDHGVGLVPRVQPQPFGVVSVSQAVANLPRLSDSSPIGLEAAAEEAGPR